LKPDCEGEEYSEVVRFVGYKWRMPKQINLDSRGLESVPKTNKFLKISTSEKTVNNDADVVDNEDKMVAVKAIVKAQLVVKLTPNEDKMVAPILISEGA
jgi:hypothetical protein